MPVIGLDLSQIPDSDLIPPGQYPAVVDKVELRKSQKNPNGDPYLNWTFTLADETYTGRKMFFTTSLGQVSLWNLKKQLKALGEDANAINELVVDDATNILVEPNFSGRNCTILLYNNVGQDGVERTQVKTIVGEATAVAEGADSATLRL